MELLASQTPEGEKPPPINKVDVWLRVVGPPKKGKTVYGMGSLSSSCLDKSTMYKSSSSSSCPSAHPVNYIHTSEFHQSVNESVQKVLGSYLQELRESNERLQLKVNSLTEEIKQLKDPNPSQGGF